jgi:hypothetical protein
LTLARGANLGHVQIEVRALLRNAERFLAALEQRPKRPNRASSAPTRCGWRRMALTCKRCSTRRRRFPTPLRVWLHNHSDGGYGLTYPLPRTPGGWDDRQVGEMAIADALVAPGRARDTEGPLIYQGDYIRRRSGRTPQPTPPISLIPSNMCSSMPQ